MGDASGGVIDLRPLIQTARHHPSVDPELRHLILAFDFFVFLRDSFEHLKTPNSQWYPEE